MDQRIFFALLTAALAQSGGCQNAAASAADAPAPAAGQLRPAGDSFAELRPAASRSSYPGRKPAGKALLRLADNTAGADEPAPKPASDQAAPKPASDEPAQMPAAGDAAEKQAGESAQPAAEDAAAKRKAEEAAQKAAEATPAFSQALNKGVELYNQNKTQEALLEFDKAKNISPNNTGVLNWIGATYQKMNKHKEAVEIYEKVVDVDPNYAEAHNNLAYSYQQLQDFEKSETEYKRALELKPGFNEARFNLACVLQNEKKNDEAITEFENVLKADPARTDCYLHIGDVAKENKNYDLALEYYNKALTEVKKAGNKDPQGMANILCAIALIDKEKGDKSKCKDGLEKVLDLDPGNYQAFLNLGIMDIEDKDYTSALNHLAKALERNPYDAAVHFWLGRYYYSLDSLKNAIKQFSDCLRCDEAEHKFPECQEWLDKAKKKQESF